MNPKIADVIARVKYELECTEQFVSESIPVNRSDIAALMAELDKLQAIAAVGGEPVYQFRIDGTGGWQDCSAVDLCSYHVDERRVLYTQAAQPSAAVVDEAMVLRACNAYDRTRNDLQNMDTASEYPAMWHAIKAAQPSAAVGGDKETVESIKAYAYDQAVDCIEPFVWRDLSCRHHMHAEPWHLPASLVESVEILVNHWKETKQAAQPSVMVVDDAMVSTLEQVLRFVNTETTECRGDKCRESWCISCFGDEHAEASAAEASEVYRNAHEFLAKHKAAQPSKVVVDEAMVERGLQGAIGASDARLARYSVVRAILESAITAQGEVR